MEFIAVNSGGLSSIGRNGMAKKRNHFGGIGETYDMMDGWRWLCVQRERYVDWWDLKGRWLVAWFYKVQASSSYKRDEPSVY